MKRFVSSLMVVCMLASSVPAFADDTVAPPTIAPLDKGQPAPFTGVLLSPPAVAQVISERDAATARLQLAVQHQLELDSAKTTYQVDSLTTTYMTDKSVLQAQVDDGKRQIIVLNDQVKKATSGPGTPFWIGVGAVAGVVLSVLTVFAIGKASN